MGEINLILCDISNALTHLQKWSSPRNAQKDLVHQFDKVYLVPEPYGTVLIIVPWNYPIGLLIEPLIGAIAAGMVLFYAASFTYWGVKHCHLKLPNFLFVQWN